MYVTACESKFHALTTYSNQLVATEKEIIRLFIKGINYEVRVSSI